MSADDTARFVAANGARVHILGHQFQPPGMGGGTGCAVMIDEGILCGESRDHRIHRAPDDGEAA